MGKLLPFLKPYRKRLVFMLVLLFVKVLGTLYIPTLTANMINNGIVQSDLGYVWKMSGFMLAVAVGTAAVSILGTYLSAYIGMGIGHDIRGALFSKAQDFSVNDFNKFGAASLITRSTSDVTQIQQAFSSIVEMLLPAPFMTIAGLVLAFSKNRGLALIILGLMILIFIVTIAIGKKVVPIYDRLQEQLDGINRTVRESITGVRVIRAFNRTEDDKRKLDRAFTNYADTAIRTNQIFAVLMPFIMLLMNVGTILIVWFGGKQAAAGNIGIGDIMAVIEYATLTLMYMVMGVAVFLFIPRAQTCAKRINDVLKMKPEFFKDDDSEGTAVKGTDVSGDSEEKVSFQNVTFRYADAQEPVLHNIDFSVKKGETTAIIGSTGSGKSTIAELMLHFYDAESGKILIDGKDVRMYSQKELREKIGYVPQKAFLFSGTIADNLRHGRRNATPEEMRHAVQIAQMESFVDESEKKFDMAVSQGGSNFSGGQRQRLSIARAIIKKPEIYVFDDSFSALDFKTDARLRAALKPETASGSVIIIAQRISTIIDADQIIVLDEGRIVGKGTHRELMKNCQVYQQIAYSQLSEEELK